MLGEPLTAEEVCLFQISLKSQTIFLHFFYRICFLKVAEFMAEADVDQNGKLDYDEFSRMLLREPTFDN